MPQLADAKPLRRQGNRIVTEEEYEPRAWVKRQTARKKENSKFRLHQFVCFDGEGLEVNGRHEYV